MLINGKCFQPLELIEHIGGQLSNHLIIDLLEFVKIENSILEA
jgi:hypothetical protein